jgi:hypothetical protein
LKPLTAVVWAGVALAFIGGLSDRPYVFVLGVAVFVVAGLWNRRPVGP